MRALRRHAVGRRTRPFTSGPDERLERRLKDTMALSNPLQGRDSWSDAFEQRVSLLPQANPSDIFTDVGEHTAMVDARPWEDFHSEIVQPLPLGFLQGRSAFPAAVKRRMAKNSDGAWIDSIEGDRHLIGVSDPDLRHAMYRRDEAQVELISAYRNVLYEVVDLPNVTTVRCPLLAWSRVNDIVRYQLPKIQHMSVVKGFHRVSVEGRRLLTDRGLRFELYVPDAMLSDYRAAFASGAWPIPTSMVHGSTQLYPGMAAPRTLLEDDGWTGRRRELVEATEQGRALEGPQRGIDGEVVQPMDVLAAMPIAEPYVERRERVVRERAAAQQEGHEPPAQRRLTSGIEGDGGQPVAHKPIWAGVSGA